MKQEILNYLKTNASKHVFAIAAVALGLLLGHSWLAEHDARLLADSQVKAAQVQIASLQKQQATVTQAAKVQVVRLQAAAAEVKTAPEAIAAIPEVAPVALNVQALPDAPDAVKVDAVPFYQFANSCKQDAVNLGACTTNLGIQKEIDSKKDDQITALKKKPGFWHRVKDTAITLGVGAGIAYVATHH